MNKAIMGATAALLTGTGLALADPCGTPACVPTTTAPPLTFFHQPELPPPVYAPPTPIPGPTIFRRQVLPPTWTEAKPAPPVELFRATPPPVTLFRATPPPVEFFRVQPSPPEWVHVPPPPPLTVFRRVPGTPRYAPPCTCPGVTLYQQPQPPRPCCPPPAPCCGGEQAVPCEAGEGAMMLGAVPGP